MKDHSPRSYIILQSYLPEDPHIDFTTKWTRVMVERMTPSPGNLLPNQKNKLEMVPHLRKSHRGQCQAQGLEAFHSGRNRDLSLMKNKTYSLHARLPFPLCEDLQSSWSASQHRLGWKDTVESEGCASSERCTAVRTACLTQTSWVLSNSPDTVGEYWILLVS